MDLWPASLCVGGVSKDSAVYKFYYRISKKIYEQVDVLLVTSRKFKDYFIEEFGIPENKIVYLPQYALSTFDHIPQGGENLKGISILCRYIEGLVPGAKIKD